MKTERSDVSNQLALISEKETQIDRLTSQMAILTQEKEQMRVEMGLLNEKYFSAQQQFQTLAEAEQTRLLHNEKVKLTLKTEIELLRGSVSYMIKGHVTFPLAARLTQRVLAKGEETGQKERMIPYGETTSPGFSSQSQSDDSEREDGALNHQIALLTVKNNNLQQQLKERELERDRLREQLELQRQERNSRTPYSPTGLPSRLLDGRKV